LFNAVTGIGALPASLLMGWMWSCFGPAAAFRCGSALAFLAAVWLLVRVPSIAPARTPSPD
jgi:hypothetical protein